MKNLLNQKYKGRQILVMGLGFNGGGVDTANAFFKLGAKVVITDLRPKRELENSLKGLKGDFDLILGRHRKKDFRKMDLIVKSPAVSWDNRLIKTALNNGVSVETDAELFMKCIDSKKVIGITGTKGKTTTANLVYRVLKTKHQRVLLGGVPGKGIFSMALKDADRYVVEFSSFDLEKIRTNPGTAIITNIFPDHLNRYKNFTEYKNTKKNIFRYQRKGEQLFLPQELRGITKREAIIFKHQRDLLYKLAREEKIKRDIVNKILVDFRGLSGRLELIRTYKGIKFYNNTTATNPGALIYSLNRFTGESGISVRRIILIAGGKNKGLRYGKVVKAIKNKVVFTIFLPGSATDKILEEAKRMKYNSFVLASTMGDAVGKALIRAKKGDVVLLSPGTASFNIFRNEFHRGEEFNKAVKDYY